MGDPPNAVDAHLPQLLALIHDAHSQLGSLTATYRDWALPTRSLGVRLTRASPGAVPTAEWAGAGPLPQPMVQERRIWFSAPWLLRVEVWINRRLRRIGILAQDDWRLWDESQPEIPERPSPARRSGPPSLLLPPILEPVRLLEAVRFTAVSEGIFQHRPAFEVQATPRHASGPQARFGMAFTFDKEHGTMLARSTYDGPELTRSSQAADLFYGQAIDPSRFDFDAAPAAFAGVNNA